MFWKWYKMLPQFRFRSGGKRFKDFCFNSIPSLLFVMYAFLLSFYLFIIAYLRKVSSRSAVMIDSMESFDTDNEDQFSLHLKSRNEDVSALYDLHNEIMSQDFKIISANINRMESGNTIIKLQFDENKSLEIKKCAETFADYNEELIDVYYDEELLEKDDTGLQEGLD